MPAGVRISKRKLKKRYLEIKTQTGLSDEEIAEQIGVTRQTLWRWINGTNNPQIKSLAKLAKALKISWKDLIRS